mgnify:FL=1
MASSMISNFGIFSRYLIQRTFIISCLVLLIFIALDCIFLVIAEMEDISSEYNFNQLLRYVLGTSPHSALTYLEGSCLLGMLISMSISQQEGNLGIMRSGGFSPLRISIVSSIGAIGMILIFLVSDELFFKDMSMKAEVQKNLITSSSQNKTNVSANWIEDDGTYLQYFIKDSETLYDISIVKIKNDKVLYSTSSNKAYISENSITLAEPFIFKNFENSEVSFQEIPFQFPKVLQLSSPNIKNIKLTDQLDIFRKLNTAKVSRFKSDLEKNIYKTLLLPISALAIMLLAGSLMFGSLRESAMGTKIIFGVIGGFIYGVIQDLTVSIFITYSLNILFAVLFPILLVLVLSLIFYKKI